MGTNYYIIENMKPPCSCCGRPYEHEQVHIGKSSFGWKFLFSSVKGQYRDFKSWLEFVEKYKDSIYDEYERKVELEDLLKLIANKQENFKQEKVVNVGDDFDYLDPEGYRFTDYEFS